MNQTPASFERFAADRLIQERDQITRDWVEMLASQLRIDPRRVLPHQDLLDHIPVILTRAAEFLLVPDREKFAAEQLVVDEMRDIAHLRRGQGYPVQEIIREFDELARTLDGAALTWIDEFPGTPDPKEVGRVFGRLNRVPLLMGQLTTGTLEDERNDLLRQLASAEEEERQRLSRELHDQIGQLLTALLLGLRSLRDAAADGDLAARIGALEELADRVARETQQLALDLRPPALNSFGLRLALESLLDDWSERHRIATDLQSIGLADRRFAPEVEVALYRIVQEGLTNVLKHARAAHVSVVLEYRDGFVRLIMEDDGEGFDSDSLLASPEKSQRLGVRGMRERAALLGGRLEVESSPGSGTSLFVRIPAPAGGEE